MSDRLVARLPQVPMRETGTPGVRAAQFGRTWRALVRYEDGWDVTGEPYTTLRDVCTVAPGLARIAYGSAAA